MKINVGNVSKLVQTIFFDIPVRGYFEISLFEISEVDLFWSVDGLRCHCLIYQKLTSFGVLMGHHICYAPSL